MPTLQQELRTVFALLLISLTLFLLDNLSFLYYPKSFLSSILSPIQYGIYQTSQGVTGKFEVVRQMKSAAQENQALQVQLSSLLIENSTLRGEINRLKATVSQNEALSPTTYKMVLATPIGFSRYLTLNIGSSKGIAPDMPVVFQDSLIGTIKDVTSDRSRVILLSDPDSKVSAFASNGQAKTKGVLVGEYGQEMLLDKILHQEPIAVGDTVYTDGLETNLPKGLILGSVSEVISSDNQVFKQAKVRVIQKVEDLDAVFIITN